MERIAHSTAAPSLPSYADTGTPGYFRNENLGLGQEGTAITADWLNGIQEELVSVIEESGQTLDPENLGQLLAAIRYFSATENLIDNANFDINQLALSGAVTLSAGQHGHDRWKAGAAGCQYTFSTAAGITTLTIASGSLIQIIEASNILGGTYAMAWAGTAQGKIGGGSLGASGITGTATGGSNLTVEFGPGTLSQVRLRPGPVAGPFRRRHIAQELAVCQRYYETSYPLGSAPGSVVVNGGNPNRVTLSGDAVVVGDKFHVRKRINPTITIYRPSTGEVGKVETYGEAYPQTVSSVERSEVGIGLIVLSSPMGSAAMLQYHWVADARL